MSHYNKRQKLVKHEVARVGKDKELKFFAPGWVLLAVGYFYLYVIQTDPINVIPHREVAASSSLDSVCNTIV